MNKQLKQNVCVAKSVDLENRTIEMVGSTEDYDRAGDKMFMSGVDLTNFKKNPVILPNHDYHATAIGKCLDVRVEGKSLIFKIKFAETKHGNEWFYLYSNGYMNGSSIGFNPIEYKPNDKGGYDFTKWELLELSLVTVPCNQNAIQRMKKELKEGKITEAMYKELANLGNFNNNEEDVLNMNKEELQKLVDDSVNNAVKSLKEQHEAELNEKVKEIEKLQGELAEVTKSIEDNTVKAGASHSKQTIEVISKSCEGMLQHIKALQNLVGCEDDGKEPMGKSAEPVEPQEETIPNEEEAVEYSDEDIAKLVNESLEKLLEGYSA